MQHNSFLKELCIDVYRYHELHGHPVLSSIQIAQLNFYLMSDVGDFTISFPVPETMVIFNDDYIIEYIHFSVPIVNVRKQMVTVLDRFNQSDLQGKANLIFMDGELLFANNGSRKKIHLYAMHGFLVEIFYNSFKEIERIEMVTGLKKLSKYLERIRIDDLLK